MVIELYRVACPDCGLKTEKVDSLPSKAPFSKRFEDAVGMLRECPHTSSGTAVCTPREYGAGHGFALFTPLGGAPPKAGLAADGSR